MFGNAIDLDRHLIPGTIRDQTGDSEGSYVRWIDDLIQRQADSEDNCESARTLGKE